MSTVGIGLIGCGNRLTEVMARVVQGHEGVRVTALCDVSDDALDLARRRCECPDAVVHQDYRDLINDPSVDWVAVGSWNCFHKEHILAALEAEKHVFSEKPLTINIEDCALLKKAIEEKKLLFSMGFILRYAEFYRRVKALIEDGVIGEIVSFEFNETLDFNHGGYIMQDWRRFRENAGTHLLEKCSHDFDLANWLTGSLPVRTASFGGLSFFTPENAGLINEIEPTEDGVPAYQTWQQMGIYTRANRLNPFTTEKNIIDNQVVILEYANGVRATFHTNLNTAIPERRFYLCGTKGTIRGDVMAGHIEYRRIGFDPGTVHEKTASGGHGGADGILADGIRDSMLNGTVPVVGLEDGVKSAVACFGVDKAMDSGQVVDLRPMWDLVDIQP
ncbi:Gfo/Idh/MocA family protein [Tichowtungia aerotolerans]|uniref:Gfo/Idh/MocA family oxidoreductase n=1 Tax=Tichowtungia aerotolerans TaxID=2697043 RepID=A0A6P1M1P3_9BACT|nr:Gfo/Idh/MocA family oxidoreductase [Tichowtungia aerotolerans]QHI68032.1 Gfo/Idh/MocA family oxidoreductase [Tichowtungia aerotolerans]